MTPLFQRTDNSKEFLVAEHASATKIGLVADFDHLGHSAYVVIVPVCRNNQLDCFRRVDADAIKIFQGSWLPVAANAGIHDYPTATAEMQDNALPISRAQKRDLELFLTWRGLRVPG